MRTTFTLVVLAVLGSGATAGRPATVTYEDESALRFRTADVVPEGLIVGENYELDRETTLDRGRFVFRIRTKWGDMVAHGRPMLALRLHEMAVVEEARRRNRQPQLVVGFLNTLVDSGRGTKLLLTDPIGAVRRAPEGVEKKVRGFVDEENRRSGTETRRRIAADLDCDPETDNPVLSNLLDWIARRQGVGGFVGKVGLNVITPGLALIPTTAQIQRTVATRSPAEINADVERQLAEADYAPDLVRRFLESKGATTLQRLMTAERLVVLARVPGQDRLLRRAADAETTADALVVLHELERIVRLHGNDAVVRVDDTGYPLVVTRTGRRVAVCAEGYRVFDRDLHRYAVTTRTAAGSHPVEWHGSAFLGERAEAELANLGIRHVARDDR